MNGLNMDAEKFIDQGWRGTSWRIEKCEFCGKKRRVVSTTFVCGYCAECHDLNAGESQDAIKRLKQANPG